MPLKVKNVAAGFFVDGKFHPIRASKDYAPEKIDEPFDYKKISKKKRTEKAKRAEEIAKAARDAWRKKKKAEKESAKTAVRGKAKPTARKKAVSAAEKMAARKARKAARKKNPIPANRWVPAKVRRTRSGDIKLILPL